MAAWSVERCSEIVPAAVGWLWPKYLPRGKLVLLDGDPEMGKSLIAVDLIARLSRGEPLPDGTPVARPCNGIILSAEEDGADTIRPRAEAAGTDLSRLFLPRFQDRTPRFPDDLAALEEIIYDVAADLVVVDPILAFLAPNVAANLDQCVRQALTPLAKLAEETSCTFLFHRHLTKAGKDRAIHRGQGSMGIIAAVRTALLVAPGPDGGTVPSGSGESGESSPTRILSVSKSNLSRRPPSLGYRIGVAENGQPIIEWMGNTNLTADDLCKKKQVEARLKPRDYAIDWLRRELANGPRKAADLYAAAVGAGIPERTFRRAKTDLPARSHRTYDHKESRGEWYWYDPDAPWPKSAPFKKPYELPPLDPLGDL